MLIFENGASGVSHYNCYVWQAFETRQHRVQYDITFMVLAVSCGNVSALITMLCVSLLVGY